MGYGSNLDQIRTWYQCNFLNLFLILCFLLLHPIIIVVDWYPFPYSLCPPTSPELSFFLKLFTFFFFRRFVQAFDEILTEVTKVASPLAAAAALTVVVSNPPTICRRTVVECRCNAEPAPPLSPGHVSPEPLLPGCTRDPTASVIMG